MATIICTAITGIATIVCAYMGIISTKNEKAQVKRDAMVDKRAEQRAKEGKLQLKMLNANTKLCCGLAMAMKHGKCNGEVEDGLKAVASAEEEYRKFLEEIAIDELR